MHRVNNPRFFTYMLPGFLFLLLLLVVSGVQLAQIQSYGLTMDQGLQTRYGQTVLRWYTSRGQDLSFLQFPADEYEPEHGPLVVVAIAEAQQIFHGGWLTE